MVEVVHNDTLWRPRVPALVFAAGLGRSPFAHVRELERVQADAATLQRVLPPRHGRANAKEDSFSHAGT